VTNALREITGKPVTIETSAAESGIRRLRDEVAMWGLAIRGAVDSFRMVGQALNVVLKPAMEAEQGLNRVKAVVESTGQAAGFAAEEIARQAADIQEAFAFDDDMIMNDLMTPLLTFANVTGDAFQQAQVAIMDMNRALGEDGGGLKAVALQVGKALQDPILGLTALRRSGVSFTDEQQKVIKSMVDAGDAAGAQKIILAELNKEFGGQAAAYADSYAGRLAKMKNAMGDLAQSIGELVLPVLTALADILKPLIEWFTGLDGAIKVLLVTLPLATGAWYKLIAAKVTAATVTGALTGAITAAGVAVKGFLTTIGPVGWVLLGATAAVTAYGVATSGAKKETEELAERNKEFASSMSQIRTEALGNITRFDTLVKTYEDLRGKQRLTSEQTLLLRNTIAALKREYPTYLGNLDMEKGKYDKIKGAISATRTELDRLSRKRIQDAIVSNYTEEIAKAQMELSRLEDEYTSLWEKSKAMSTRNNILNSVSAEIVTGKMEKTQAAIRKQIDIIDTYQDRMESALKKGLSISLDQGPGDGGGAAAAAVGNVDNALSDWERLDQRLKDYFAGESTKLLQQYKADLAVIDKEYANDKEGHYFALQRLDAWYTEEERKLNERVQAKRLEDEEKYYEQLKGQDAGYYAWRLARIEEDVRKLDLSEEQRNALIAAYTADLDAELKGGQTANVAQLEAYYNEVRFLDSGYYEWKRIRIAEEVALMGLSAEQAQLIMDERVAALDKEREAIERLPLEELLARYRAFKEEMADTKTIGVAAWAAIRDGLIALRGELEAFANIPGVKEVLEKLQGEIDIAQLNAGSRKGNWFWNGLLGFDPDSAEDREKLNRVKAAFKQTEDDITGILGGLQTLNNQRRDQELASIDQMAKNQTINDAEAIRRKENITKKYAEEARKIGRIQQAVSIVQTTISTAESAVAAYKALVGIPIVGPLLAPAAAAAAIAAGAIQVAIIKAQKFAGGGLFSGEGGPRDDKNLVMLSNGEFVVSAAATKRFLPLLEQINDEGNGVKSFSGLERNILYTIGENLGFKNAPYGGVIPYARPKKSEYADGGLVTGGGGLLSYLGAKLDVVARKLDAVNMNIANIDLGVTLINHAPDVNTTVEKHEIAKARQQARGKVYSYGV